MDEHTFDICFMDSNEERRLIITLVHFDDTISELHHCLGREEQSIYRKFKVDSRRNQFIAGRYVAKRGIQTFFPSYDLKSITIMPGVWGFPLVQTEGLYQTDISIAHTGHFAASLFSPVNTHPVGVDIEEMEENHNPSLERFMSGKELVLVDEAGYSDTELLHILWSSKEAAGKALRIGFNAPENLYSISSVENINGIYHICFDQLPQLKTIGWIQDDLVICVAFPSARSFKKINKRAAYEKENHT